MNSEELCEECIDKEDLTIKVNELSKLIYDETVQVVFDFGYLQIEDGIGECEICLSELYRDKLYIRIKRYEEETMQPSYKNSTIEIKSNQISDIDIHSEEFKDGFKCIATIYLINPDHDVTFYLVGDTIKDQEKRPNKFYEMYKEDIIEFHNSKNES